MALARRAGRTKKIAKPGVGNESGRRAIPMTESEKPGPSGARPWSRDLLLLAAAFGVLYFFMIGRAALGNPDEGRYAEIPREMLRTGDWVTPRLDGLPYFEKPPLGYWVTAACLRVLGPGEGAARAMPALFGVGGVLLTYAAARRLCGRRAGILSAVVLGTSVLYLALTRVLILDLAVSVLMSATLFLFILGIREPPGPRRRGLFLGLYATAALATLTKGLIGVLLTGAVMFLWLLLLDEWRRLRPLHLAPGALVFLAIALPWHLLVNARNPGWARFYFVHEQWERFLAPSGHGRTGPWWYFIPAVILGLFPWTGFLWPALRDALRGGWRARRVAADAWYLVIWAGFIFLFFSKSQSKLVPYILPVFPPLAVLVGTWLARRLEAGDAARLRWGLRTHAVISVVLAAAVGVVAARPDLFRMNPDQAEALRPCAILAGLVLLGGAAAVQALAARPRAAVAALVASMAVFFGVLAAAERVFQKPGTRELALDVAALARPGDTVCHYHEFFHDFTFYARRTVVLVGFRGELDEPQNDRAGREGGQFIDEAEFRRRWEGPGRIFVVARKRDIAELFADPAFHYHLLAASPDHTLFSNRP
jgi:4-amino-4-deoxy-L-arabinose transferase-like glycosyltransferase